MSERDEMLFDIESNLLPMVHRYAKTYAARDSKASQKQLERIRKRLVKLIQDTQPMPEMEGDE